jgi:hypothetical protein
MLHQMSGGNRTLHQGPYVMTTNIASTPVFNSVRALIFEQRSIPRDKLRRASGTTAATLDFIVDRLVARGCIEQNRRLTGDRPVTLCELPRSPQFWSCAAA